MSTDAAVTVRRGWASGSVHDLADERALGASVTGPVWPVAENGRMSMTVRAVMADDGVHRARLWRETGVGNPTSVPFYEQRMGYSRQEVVFRKALR
jgi:hypothetical protein